MVTKLIIVSKVAGGFTTQPFPRLETHMVLCKKIACYCHWIWTNIDTCLQKLSSVKFRKNMSSGSWVDTRGPTDGHGEANWRIFVNSGLNTP
jgi:hypothetical protein